MILSSLGRTILWSDAGDDPLRSIWTDALCCPLRETCARRLVERQQRLDGQIPTVHRKRDTMNIACFVAGKIQRGLGNLFGHRIAPGRQAASDLLQALQLLLRTW